MIAGFDATAEGPHRRSRHSAFAAALAVALALMACWPSAGGAFDLHRFPGNYRAKSPDETTCIGKPRTPVCAMLTFHACLTFREPSLCNLIGVRGLVEVPFERPHDHTNFVEVIFVRPIPRELARGMPSMWRYSPRKRPGEVEIGIFSQWCPGTEPCPGEVVSDVSIFVARERGLWKVVGWTDSVGYAQCENYREPYGRHCNIYIDEDDYRTYLRSSPLVVDLKASKLLSQTDKDHSAELGSYLWLQKLRETEVPEAQPPTNPAR